MAKECPRKKPRAKEVVVAAKVSSRVVPASLRLRPLGSALPTLVDSRRIIGVRAINNRRWPRGSLVAQTLAAVFKKRRDVDEYKLYRITFYRKPASWSTLGRLRGCFPLDHRCDYEYNSSVVFHCLFAVYSIAAVNILQLLILILRGYLPSCWLLILFSNRKRSERKTMTNSKLTDATTLCT